MSPKARDIMEPHVVTLSPEVPLVTAHRVFVEDRIHGAPVVDDQERIVGIITSTDLLRAVFEEHDTAGWHVEYLRELLEFSGPDWGRGTSDFQDRLAALCVSDFMNEHIVSVGPDTPVNEVAQTLRKAGIHRVLVVEKDQLLGIITTFDLLEVLEKSA
jgi:CBS domain-containing protein